MRASLYWSVGTGRGDYDESSFDLQGDGVMRSPITYLNLPKSQVLMAQMMSDRNEVGTWLLDTANGFTLRDEKTLWINHAFSRRRGLMDAANWTPPRGIRDDPDRCMARSRARAALFGRRDPEAPATPAEEGLRAPSRTPPT